MKYSFEFSNLCGSSFKGGNVIFTRDGNSVLSPVGNRISMFDLVNHKCSTFPFENQRNIARVVLSPDGNTLISVDEDGRALLINFHKRVVINRFNFKTPIVDLQFSPDSKWLAVTMEKRVQVWQVPTLMTQFSPFTLFRTYPAHADSVVHVNWSPDSLFFFTCSKDMSVKMFSLNTIDGFRPLTLNGHRGHTVASFIDSDNTLYTISRDSALFVWKFVEAEGDDVDMSLPVLGRGRFEIDNKHYFMKNHAKVACAAFHQSRNINMLVVGFESGMFSLFDLPACQEIHSLSISQEQIGVEMIDVAAVLPDLWLNVADWIGLQWNQ